MMTDDKPRSGHSARPSVPIELVAHLPAVLKQRVLASDDAVAAEAMLDVVDALPAFSSYVAQGSAWLERVRAAVARLGEQCPERTEVRLLAAIARMAFAARETGPALAAAEAALARAVEVGDVELQATILAQRLPFLAHVSPVPAARDIRALDTALGQLPPTLQPSHRDGDVALARIAWAGATGDQTRMRRELAAFGRLRLPEDERLAHFAFATHLGLAQLHLRSHQRAPAAAALIHAAKLADAHEAVAELVNVQACIAALAMQAGDFHAAVAHAHSAISPSQSLRRSQPDPWLGLPLDVAQAHNPGEAVGLLAEAVLHAQDLGDSTGFFVAATAMAAFYLADRRAMEALDGLNEAADVAKSMSDPSVVAALREVSESLLRHLGIFKS